MVKLIHFPALPYMDLLAPNKMNFFDELLFHFSLFSVRVEALLHEALNEDKWNLYLLIEFNHETD